MLDKLKQMKGCIFKNTKDIIALELDGLSCKNDIHYTELESIRFGSLRFSNSKQSRHVNKYIVQNIEEALSFATSKPCFTFKLTF